ncbi:MAG: formate dehydrogenase [bacterium]|nr:formate dehydrogenase [bacterium]
MAANGKSFLIDTTKCTACRSCQVACKQWNELEAESTTNRGTYENPPDLSANTWVLVHFKESAQSDGTVAWNFARNSCRHCVDAPCKQRAESGDSITIDEETGAVLFGEGTQSESFDTIRQACPFNIPRQGTDGQMYKCTMCVDRVHNGELPACAKTCPVGAIQFGDRQDMLDAADARLAAIQSDYPDAAILDRNEARLLLLLGDKQSMYTTVVGA